MKAERKNGRIVGAGSKAVDKVIAHAPAKINLALKVETLREGEEKHRLSSLFCTTTLQDTLVFDFISGKEPFNVQVIFQSTDFDTAFINPNDNTLTKAVEHFKREYGFGFLPSGTLCVELIKSIPACAGLGGGSSDAAALLRMLCWLAQVEPTGERSLRVARAVGADVPFFLHAPKQGFCAYMGGFGDELLEIVPKPTLNLALVKPERGVSTKKAYAAFDQLPPLAEQEQDKENGKDFKNPVFPLAAALTEGKDLATIAALCTNTLEPVAVQLLPVIGEIKSEMEGMAGVAGVLLSGSGSALFALCESTEASRACVQQFAKRGFWAVSVQT